LASSRGVQDRLAIHAGNVGAASSEHGKHG
jgi:hypothetical protein